MEAVTARLAGSLSVMSATTDNASAVGHAAAAQDAAHGAHAHGHAHSHAESAFMWRPHVDLLDCRYHGLWLHALLMVALALGAIPLATRKLAPPRVSVVASAGLVVAAFGMRVSQSVCATRGGTARLAASNMHAVAGWAATAAVAVVSACASQGVGCTAAAAHTRALARRVAHAAFGVEMGLLAWASAIWLVAACLCLLTGMWAALDCYSSPKFVGYEIGHLVPASLWMLSAVVSLAHCAGGGPQHLARLQLAEAKMMLAGGMLFLVEITVAHHGGMLRKGGGTHHDQQHQTSGIVWLSCGALAYTLHYFKTVTGIHILVSSVGHSLMIMYHAQFSELSALAHQVHGGLLLLAALLRLGNRLVEYSLVLALAALCFIMSSECPVRWAEDVAVNPSAYVLATMAAGSLLWTWTVRLMWGPAAAAAAVAGDLKADQHAHV